MKINLYNVKLRKKSRIPYLVKDGEVEYGNKYVLLNKPEAVVDFFVKKFELDVLAEEYVYMVALTSELMPIGVFPISHGAVNISICNTREIMQRALLAGANGIVICHNHPSGSIKPSLSDFEVYEKIKSACQMMKIEMVDFFIIGRGYTSFSESGLL